MVKMRRADYHPLEIVVKAAFILLIVGETNGDTKLDLYDFAPFRDKGQPTFNLGLPYIPFRYSEHFPHKIQPNKDDSSHRITFPEDDFISTRFQEDLLKNPPMCEDNTFCEDPPYYPTELVKQVLMKNESLKNYAFVDSVGDIAQRIDTEDEAPLCFSTTQVIFPKVMKREDNVQSYIVQDDEMNMKQGVLIEKCDEQSKPCRVIDGFASGYETQCKQRYVHRQLLVIKEKGVTATESFPMPSSCCCSVTFSGRKKRSPFLKNAEDTV